MLGLLAEETKGHLPEDAKEVASLVTTTHFRCAYATYAHQMMATRLNWLTEIQAAGIAAGSKPEGLNKGCSIAYDAAKQLLEVRGPLPSELWDRCVSVFGKEGTVGLVHYVALLTWTSLGLNAADVPAPSLAPAK